jgi:FAD-dependent urate hydroxylase
VILGDAAHAASPSTSQGASVAAEDGVALAMAVRDHADTESALRLFVDARRPRVEQVVAYGRRYSNVKLVGPIRRFVRDFMLPWVFKAQLKPDRCRSLDWLFDYRLEWTR